MEDEKSHSHTHSFYIEVAKEFDIPISTLVLNLDLWISNNIRKNKHEKLGRNWTYGTAKSYAQNLPYLSERQVGYLLDSCVSNGILWKDNFNKHKYDRTKWYTFTDGFLIKNPFLKSHIEYKNLLETAPPLISPNREMDFTKLQNAFHENGISIYQICKMDFTKLQNAFHDLGVTIPCKYSIKLSKYINHISIQVSAHTRKDFFAVSLRHLRFALGTPTATSNYLTGLRKGSVLEYDLVPEPTATELLNSGNSLVSLPDGRWIIDTENLIQLINKAAAAVHKPL